MNIAIIGYGGVGKALVRLLNMQEEVLAKDHLHIQVPYIVDYYGGIYRQRASTFSSLPLLQKRKKISPNSPGAARTSP